MTRHDCRPRRLAAPDVILFGLGRFGSAVARILTERGIRVLAVDSDPDRVRTRAGQGFELRYGDAEDPEFVGSLPLGRV